MLRLKEKGKLCTLFALRISFLSKSIWDIVQELEMDLRDIANESDTDTD
jgi:hypothetical protein